MKQIKHQLSKILKPYLRDLFLSPEISTGTFEQLHLKNSNQFIIQYSRAGHDGSTVYGLGNDENLESAKIKAYGEFVERMSFLTNGIPLGFFSTNGIACHPIRAIAYKNAKDELFERDAFLMHWYSEVPMLEVTSQHTNTLENEIRKTQNLGFVTKFFHTFLGYQQATVCCLINKVTGGFCIGLSSGRGLIQDLSKSFLEASINLFLCEDADHSINFSVETELSLKHHRDYWLFNCTLPDWILKRPHFMPDRRAKSPVINETVLPSEAFVTVALESDQVLPLRLGSPTRADLEMVDRRIQGLGLQLNYSKNLIHPIP